MTELVITVLMKSPSFIECHYDPDMVVVVQSLSRVRLFTTPWTAAHEASLFFTISQSLLKLISVESVMPPNHLGLSVIPFSSCLQSFPESGSFPISRLVASGGQSIGASASTLVLSMNIQDWFHLGLTGLISLKSKGLSRVFSSTTIQKHQFFPFMDCIIVFKAMLLLLDICLFPV